VSAKQESEDDGKGNQVQRWGNILRIPGKYEKTHGVGVKALED
jgi:hypothetical protein